MASKKKDYESGSRAAFLFLGVLLLVAGALALLSVIGKTDSTLFVSIREICYGSAGSLSLGIGIIFIWLGLISAFSAGRSVSKREFLLCFLIYLCVLAIINLMSRVQYSTFPDYIVNCNKSSQVIDPESFGSVLMGAFRECAVLGQGGGLLGMLIAFPAWKIGGVTFGTVLVGFLGIVLVILLLKIDVRGITDTLQHKSELRAQEKAHRRREREHQERLQEQERRRMEDDAKLRSPAYQRRTQPVNQPMNFPQDAYAQDNAPIQTNQIPPWLQSRNQDQPVMYDEVVSDQPQNFFQRLGQRSHTQQEVDPVNVYSSRNPASQDSIEQEMETYRQRIRGSEAAARDLNLNVFSRPVDEEFPKTPIQSPEVGSNPYVRNQQEESAILHPYSRDEQSVQDKIVPEGENRNPYMRPVEESSGSEEADMQGKTSELENRGTTEDPASSHVNPDTIEKEPAPFASNTDARQAAGIFQQAVKEENANGCSEPDWRNASGMASQPSTENRQGLIDEKPQESQSAQTNRINIFAKPAPNSSAQTSTASSSALYREAKPEISSGTGNRINLFAKPVQSASVPSPSTNANGEPLKASGQPSFRERTQESASAASGGVRIFEKTEQKASFMSNASVEESLRASPELIQQESASESFVSLPKRFDLLGKPAQNTKVPASQKPVFHGEPSQEETQDEAIPSSSHSSVQKGNPFVRNPSSNLQPSQMKASTANPNPSVASNPQPYTPPSNHLLNAGFTIEKGSTAEEDRAKAKQLEKTLQSFGIPARVERVTHGPAVTRFELGLTASGINVKRIQNLDGNIAMDMASNGGVRIEIPIPGTNLFGIEVPHQEVESVTLSEVLFSEEMKKAKSPLTVAIGKDISGKPVLCDLAKMPHLLIAGQTGSGKSVCINTIINSLIYRVSPEEVRFIMVDPKVVELQCYNGIPHLLAPVVSDPHKAAGILTWVVGEMLDRYHKMTAKGVREISAFNAKLEPGEAKIPRIVVIIDELSDLMMACRKDIEDKIIRIAQLSRAAGIHMVLATQRPTVDVITGLIKANVPSRIAFSVASATDSRTILDQNGAEKLLGRGDMFYFPTGAKSPIRVQGCFLSDGEIERIVNDVKSHGESDYDPNVVDAGENAAEKTGDGGFSPFDAPDTEGVDPRLPEAIQLVMESNLASISMLQRRMKIGHPRAGSLMDAMAERGIVSQDTGSKPREILITREEYERIKDSLF